MTLHHGDVFGKLTVLGRASTKKSGNARYRCGCACGNRDILIVRGNDLRSGKVSSCVKCK